MPLLTSEPPVSKRALWRLPLATIVAVGTFVVAVALVARATRDEAGGVRPEGPAVGDAGPASAVDAGVVVADAVVDAGGVADAGVLVDAGDVVGPEPEPDTGPIDVAGPPLVAADVVAVTVPLVEDCLVKALRFDPALGGRVQLRVVVAEGKLKLTLPGSPSPVLSSCVESGGPLVWPTAEGAHHVVTARLVLDGLRRAVRVEAAELVHE